MWSRSNRWLRAVPLHDPIELRQAGLVQVMLIGLIVGSLIALPLTSNTSSDVAGHVISQASNLLILICAVCALAVFRRGHFRRAVMLVTSGLLLGFAIYSLALGPRADSAVLSAFLLPITLAGFLAGRRGLLFSILASVAIILGTSLLQTLAPEFVGFASARGLSKEVTIGSFLLLFCLIGLFIDRFVITLRDALHEALARERDLERSRQDLELRTLELSQAKSALERELAVRSLAETALAHERDLLQALMDSSPDMIYIKDADSRFVRINHAQASLLNLTDPNAAVGKTDFDFQPRDLAQVFYAEEQQIVATGQMLLDRVEFNPTPDGRSRWLSATKGPILDGNGRVTGIVGISRDITARQEVERLKSEFISTVSHELRTPLTSIRGSLGLLVGGKAGALPDTARPILDIALRNTHRLMGLINDLLDIEKIESGNMQFAPRPIELTSLVQQTIEMNLEFAAQLKVRLALVQAPDSAWAYADSDRLVQVLTNLISNAAKFSPADSSVEISIAHRGDMIRVSVADHGPGIPPEFHTRIYDKFAQADSSDTRRKGGTGLGLSIAKTIIEQLGGGIEFTTTPGAGTTFSIDVPAWDEQDTSIAGQPA